MARRSRTAWASRILPLLLLVALPGVGQAQYDFTTNNGALTITGYTGPGGAVAIPSIIDGLPVTSIGYAAFLRLTSLTSVTIPDSVTNVGFEAFEGCSSLASVTIGNGVTSIGDDAFFVCNSLASVTIGNSVTSVGDDAFAATDLTAVYFEGNAPTAALDAFFGDFALAIYYMPGTTGWGPRFANCPTIPYPSWSSQTPPANDMLTNASVITGTAATVTGSNVGATKEAGEPNHAGNQGGMSVWWTWTAPTNGPVTLDTIGSSFDTLLAVYTGSNVSSLSAVASNDDGAANGASVLTFSAVAGTAYSIAVDGYNAGVGPPGFAPDAAHGSIVLNLWEGPLPPSITNQPQTQAVLPGSNVVFSVAASGTAPLSWQWSQGGTAIAGATASSLVITNAQAADAGVYSVVVSNLAGSVASSNAVLSVSSVVITAEPQGATVAAGYSAAFSVTAIGAAPLSYQWWKDGNAIAGATQSSFDITNAQTGDAGGYQVVASSQAGSATSSVAALTVIFPYTFATVAGQPGVHGAADGTGSAARFNSPSGVALDGAGNLYITDRYNHNIRKMTPALVVTTLAGLAGVSGTNDGVGSAARFNCPEGIALDGATNLYVADNFNHAIRIITPGGTVTTLAGRPGTEGYRDGSGQWAGFTQPSGLVLDGAGNVYVAEWGNCVIRRITPAGLVTTLAGRREMPGPNLVDGAKVRFMGPAGIALDNAGNLYVSDQNFYGNSAVRKVTPGGIVSTLALLPFVPYGGALDSSGNFYLWGMEDFALRRMTPDGVVTILAGLPGFVGSVDGAGSAARFNTLQSGIAIDASGNIFTADMDNATIRKGVPFAVTTVPQSQAVLSGTPVTLSVAAVGNNGPFSFQWLSNGVPAAGQTNLTFALGPVVRANSGVYSVVVSNTAGNSLTLNATVRALVPPVLQAPQVSPGGPVLVLFQDSDGGLPIDPGLAQVLWRTNLPSGTDTNWQVLTSGYSLTNGFIQIDDTNPPSQPSRFYRVLEQ